MLLSTLESRHPNISNHSTASNPSNIPNACVVRILAFEQQSTCATCHGMTRVSRSNRSNCKKRLIRPCNSTFPAMPEYSPQPTGTTIQSTMRPRENQQRHQHESNRKYARLQSHQSSVQAEFRLFATSRAHVGEVRPTPCHERGKEDDHVCGKRAENPRFKRADGCDDRRFFIVDEFDFAVGIGGCELLGDAVGHFRPV